MSNFIDVHDKQALQTFRNGLSVAGDADAIDKYLDSLVKHIKYVQEAGKILGVGSEQLRIHDQSKFSNDEFYAYAVHYHGGGAGEFYANAWLHHIHHNPHHWQYWIFPDGHTPKGSMVEEGTVWMQPKYSLEMIADWMGAEMTYNGSWDMTKWLKANLHKIKMHSETMIFVHQTLYDLGYHFVREGEIAEFIHPVLNNDGMEKLKV